MLSLRLSILSLKKKKESFIVLLIFIILAVLFLNQGMSVNNKANRLFFEKTEELSGAHFLIPCSLNTYRKEYEDFIKNSEHLSCFEKEEMVLMSTTRNQRNNLELGAFFQNCDISREIAPLQLMEEDTSVPADTAIYVPIQLKSENVSLGEDYDLSYKGKTYHFVVAGFFEATNYCNVSSGFYKYFVPDATYQKLLGETGKAYLLSARFAGNEKQVKEITEKLKIAFLQDTEYASDQQNLLQEVLSYEDLQIRTVTNLFVGVAIFYAVSILICLIVLFLVINHIREDIDKSMPDIGTLQAMGYTLHEIRRSYLLQFGLLGITGSLLGILSSYLAGRLMQPYFTGLCGFGWKSYYHPLEDITAFLCIVLLILFACLLALKKIRRLTPIKALSSQIQLKHGRRNFFPLQKGKLPLNLQLAVKNIFMYAKSNLLYTVIVALGAFAIGVALILFSNFAINSDVLMSAVGFELADLQVKVTKGYDPKVCEEELLHHDQVRKTNLSSTGSYLKYQKETVTTIVPEDFGKLESVIPFEGSYPETKNEVMISSLLAGEAKKKVGDSILLTGNGIDHEYLVSGIFSSTNGFVIFLKESAIKQLYPEFAFNCVDIYLKEGVDPAQFRDLLQETYKVSVDNTSSSIADQKIARLLADYHVSSVSYSIWKDGKEICRGDSRAFFISEVTDLRSFAKGQIDSYSRNLRSIVLIIFVIMLLVIGSVLRVTTKNEIQKNRKLYGIQKAVGFTTRDIMLQISLRFLITTMVGSFVGSLLAYTCAPKVFLALFSMMGVTRIQIQGYLPLLLLYSCILSGVLFVVTLLTSRRIRSITAYALLTE